MHAWELSYDNEHAVIRGLSIRVLDTFMGRGHNREFNLELESWTSQRAFSANEDARSKVVCRLHEETAIVTFTPQRRSGIA